MEGVHEGQGHQGIERCTWRVNLAFNWIGKYRDIRNHVNSCSTCNKSKTRGDGKVKIGKLIVSKPLDVLSIDFVSVDKASDGREPILVMTDVFTKFTKAVPTRNQLASTVVKVLLNKWICNFGIPRRIHSDQDRNFILSIGKELCTVYGIEQIKTTSYHPMSNGQTERMNWTIIGLLRGLTIEKKAK